MGERESLMEAVERAAVAQYHDNTSIHRVAFPMKDLP